MRKQPIYFLVDTPLSMIGEPILYFHKIISEFISLEKQNPQAIETFHICIIGSNTVKAEIILPLTPISEIINLSSFKCQGKSNIFKGIEILKNLVKNEVTKSTNEKKGDWKPILFLLVGTMPQIDIIQHDLDFLNKSFNSGYSSGSINDYSDLMQSSKLSSPNILYYKNEYVGNYFKKTFRNVENTENIDFYYLSAHFKWVS